MPMTEAPLLLGFRFIPTDEEIILGYLFKKVTNLSLPSNVALECDDIYGDEKAWQNKFQNCGEKSLYFFTNLKKKKNDNGSTIERLTASVTWRVQNDEKIMYDEQHIGSKKNFSYVAKRGSRAEARWTMTEFRLDGILRMNPEDNNYVLCQIRKLKNKGITRTESGTISIVNNAITKSAITQDVEDSGETIMITSTPMNFERARTAQMEQMHSSIVAPDDSSYPVCPLVNASSSQQPILISPPVEPAIAPTVVESGFGTRGQMGCIYTEAPGSSLVSASGRAMNTCS